MQRKHYTKNITLPDASRLRIAIVVSEFNSDITRRMLEGAVAMLEECGMRRNAIALTRVPGSFELPLGCLDYLNTKKYDAVIALGCIIKGETSHDVYIAHAVSQGLMDLSLRYAIPVIFGVITVNNLAQAKVRSTGKTNKGREAAIAAVTMALRGRKS